jgi:ABC-type lipoprotein release transport system permease subunit
VFADVTTDDAHTTLLDGGFRDVPVPANVDRLDQVGAIPWYLAAFLCVLGAAGVLHALLTALRRRRRDISIARALGVTGRAAADSLVWQAVLTALVGVGTGALLGVIVGPMTWRIIAEDLGVIARPIVPVVAVALAAAIGLTIAVLLSLGPRWRAIHLPLTHALRSE